MSTIIFTAGAKGGTGKSTAARFLVTYLREEGGETTGQSRPQEPREALVRAAAGQLKPVDLF